MNNTKRMFSLEILLLKKNKNELSPIPKQNYYPVQRKASLQFSVGIMTSCDRSAVCTFIQSQVGIYNTQKVTVDNLFFSHH